MLVSKETFKEAVSIVYSAVDRRGNIPVLSNIKLSPKGEKLSMIATDLEIGIETTVQADISENEVFLLPGKKIGRIISFLNGEGGVEIKVKEGKVKIEFDRASYSIPLFPVEEFPEEPFDREDVVFQIEMAPGELDEALKKTSFCISRDESRYMLTGVHIRGIGDKTYFVATDGYRMSVVEFEKESQINVIVPKKCVQEVRRLVKKIPMKVKIGTDNTRSKAVFSFDDENTVLWGSVIEAEYPDFLSIIPDNNEEFIVVDREELLNAVKQVASIAEDTLSAVRLKIESESNKCLVYLKEIGETDIPEEAYTEINLHTNELSEERDIGFAYKFLLEAISSFKSPEIYIFIDGDATPVVMKGEGDEGYTHVIMPKK